MYHSREGRNIIFKRIISELIQEMSRAFTCYISIKFSHSNYELVTLSQYDYINSLLGEFPTLDSKGTSFPLQVGSIHGFEDKGESFDKDKYRRPIGSLI